MVVRIRSKDPPLSPVATYITNDQHNSLHILFLGSFLTDVIRLHGRGPNKGLSMLICDGSTVLMESMAYNFCGVSLQELLSKYYSIDNWTGKA
ncbi:hypothetical protein KUCAC02_021242 [Chaenocephalus aceratus]|uniref:Uncharacterized protein n=1 Tax=Chaenocephalus aceratus TaxID=36190 RepID=A0ACB9XH15_CHAAC|nr:hypothetical protein KUCAC02_021242 [Chaenocephalus aceratus]